MPAERFVRLQRMHFFMCDALPMLLAICLPLWVDRSLFMWQGIAIGIGMWFLVGGVGISVGFHRHFSHRAFSAHHFIRFMMGVCGCMAAQGSPIYWVALHRMHHTHSDRLADPHSPQTQANQKTTPFRGFMQGHMGWVIRHDVPMPSRYARELMADPLVKTVSKHYLLWVGLGLALPTALGAFCLSTDLGMAHASLLGLYWGGLCRLAIGHHLIWSINSVCHWAGQRPHATGDRSTNVAWLALPTFGESWHNNHHSAPTHAKFAKQWWQIDLGWWVIACWQKLSLVTVRKAQA
jgi:stearoyl-CoA desaturase (delta-9 desaturase)